MSQRRWQVLAWPLAGLIALSVALVACGGDEEQPQPQAQQQTDQQDAQPDAASRSAASTERSEQSDQAEQSATSQSQDTGQAQDDAQPDGDGQADSGAAPVDPVLAAALAAAQSWSEQLERMTVAATISLPLLGTSLDFSTQIAFQAEPLLVLTTMDLGALMSSFGAEDLADEPLVMQILMSEDGAYASTPPLEGWIDLANEIDPTLGDLSNLLGFNPETLADPAGFEQIVQCVDAVGGSVAEGEHNGEAVWEIDCEIDLEQLEQAVEQLELSQLGLGLTDIRGIRLRQVISQASGAPLVTETTVLIDADSMGLVGSDDVEISTVAELTSWNEPIAFPTPEPLIEGNLNDLLAPDGLEPLNGDSASSSGSDPGPAAFSSPPTADDLLDRAGVWLLTVDDLEAEITQQLTVNRGETQNVETRIAASRSRGAFETSVSLGEMAQFGLLWTRDGLWTSEVRGRELIWTPTSPASLGFSQSSVDELLAEPALLEIPHYRLLASNAGVSRLIEGDNPPLYEFEVETGGDVAGNELLEAALELLLAEHPELLAPELEITLIDRFYVKLSFRGEEMALMQHEVQAELVTSEGDLLSLESMVTVSTEQPPVFSNPAE